MVVMKKISLADFIAWFFILLFLYTGIIKLTEIHVFKEQLTSSPLLGSIAGVIAWALPIGELLLAIALFIPKLRLKGLYFTLILMILFTAYVILVLFIDNQISCSCGGIIEELSPKQHVLFNSVCIILSWMGILSLRRQAPSAWFKWITSACASCLFLLIGWTLFTAFTAPVTVKTGMEGRPLPTFDMQLYDSLTHLNTADIPTGQPLIVIGFSPTCTHCQAETADIIKNIEKFRNARICFTTGFPLKDMQVYYRYYKLKQYPNIIMGRDSTNAFLNFFKADAVPYTAVYDSQKRLKRVMNGQAAAANLAKVIAD